MHAAWKGRRTTPCLRRQNLRLWSGRLKRLEREKGKTGMAGRSCGGGLPIETQRAVRGSMALARRLVSILFWCPSSLHTNEMVKLKVCMNWMKEVCNLNLVSLR